MDPDAILRMYLEEIGGDPLLTEQEIAELDDIITIGLYAQHQLNSQPASEIDEARAARLQRFAQTGHEAQNQLVEANLRLVVSLVKLYLGQQLELLELIQEGNMGLARAVEDYNPELGTFSNYASWWIKRSINRAIAEKSRTIRVPEAWHNSKITASSARWKLAQDLSREPTQEEISARTGISLYMLATIETMPQVVASLNAPLDNEDDNNEDLVDRLEIPQVSLEDHVVDFQIIEERFRSMSDAFRQLNNKERQILLLRFGLIDGHCYTLSEVGELFGLAPIEVRRIEAPAYRKFKKLVLQSQVTVVN